MRQLLINATVVFPDEARPAAVLIDDGVIQAIDPASAGDAQAVDLAGALLLPGLVDLHCDALEKEIEPRPRVRLPLPLALAQSDWRNAACGITTVYHALSFAEGELGVRSVVFADEIARAVADRSAPRLVDHRLHARFEITCAASAEAIGSLIADGAADLLSFMDHTPGQGQFKDVASYRGYQQRAYGRSDADLDVLLREKQEAAADALTRLDAVAGAARRAGVAMASHDDDDLERIALMAGLGVRVSEFPITIEAARAAQAAGSATVLGAPNALRGRSQSGSVSVRDAVAAGVVDALCSDYAPATLLPAAFALVELGLANLPQAVRLVTDAPARAVGLGDRGAIAVGRRADLIAVRSTDGPLVERVWSGGRLALSAERVRA